LARSVWSHNIGKGNGGDGFFFCARVHHSVCSDSVFSENGLSGIGGVARGGDHHNVISDNVCAYNSQWGIEATRGDEQVITGNLLLSNSQAERGKHCGIRLHDMERCIVQGNRCADDQERPTQTQGIVESGTSDLNLISGNLLVGMETPVVVIGKRSRAEGNL
jgi:parallel beta-helix repeat protein